MEATYLGDIELTDETLEHYGVKGMKWGVRKFDNNRIARRRNITSAAKPISSPVRRASTGTITTQRTVTPSGGGTRDASYEAQNRAKGANTSSSPVVKAKAKKAVGGLLANASGSSKKKGSGSKSKKSEAQKAKEKAEKEAAKKKKQEEKEAAKKQKEAEKAAKAAAKGSSSKEKSGSSKGESSSKSSGNEEKLKKELESYKQQLVDLAKEKQKTQISETYTKYLESLLERGNKRSQLDKIDTEEVKKRWQRKKSGMRHTSMDDGSVMIFSYELPDPMMEELFNE